MDVTFKYLDIIKEKYWNSSTLKANLVPDGGTPYLWPYTEQLAAANSAIQLLDKTKDTAKYNEMAQYIEELVEGMRYYRIQKTEGFTTTDFGVLNKAMDSEAIYNSGRGNTKDMANPSKGGTFFDDNVWVCKEFFAAYKNLGKEEYLFEAVNVMNWILADGYEEAIDPITKIPMNGIYWNWAAKDLHTGETDDSKNASLNACSSAPTAFVLMELYNELKTEKYKILADSYLLKAKKIFQFTYRVLLDENTNTIRDKVFINLNADNKLCMGIIDSQILPYNTGCLISAGVLLYEDAIVKNQASNAKIYLERVKNLTTGGDTKFASRQVMEGQYSYNDNSWFTSLFLEGLIVASRIDENCNEYIDHMRSSLEYAYKNHKAEDGLVSPAWIYGFKKFTDNGVSEGNPRQILLQSANAHCYSMVALYYKSLLS